MFVYTLGDIIAAVMIGAFILYGGALFLGAFLSDARAYIRERLGR